MYVEVHAENEEGLAGCTLVICVVVVVLVVSEVMVCALIRIPGSVSPAVSPCHQEKSSGVLDCMRQMEKMPFIYSHSRQVSLLLNISSPSVLPPRSPKLLSFTCSKLPVVYTT